LRAPNFVKVENSPKQFLLASVNEFYAQLRIPSVAIFQQNPLHWSSVKEFSCLKAIDF